MKVMAINGSPRKKWNTAMLLEIALEGAASQGAETELFHLYDLVLDLCLTSYSAPQRRSTALIPSSLRTILRYLQSVRMRR